MIVLLVLFVILGVCVGVTHYVMEMVDRSQAEVEAARSEYEASEAAGHKSAHDVNAHHRPR